MLRSDRSDHLALRRVELKIRHPLVQNVPGLILQHPTGPSSPKGATHEGQVLLQARTKPAEDRPVQAQELAAFKSDMTALIKDMI